VLAAVADRLREFQSAPGWVAGRLSQEHSPNGEKRLIVQMRIGGATISSIWEIRPRRRNRALALISMWVKK
jgi:hypothetical protein